SESAAVNPAVPTMAAWRGLRPVGNGTTHSAGTRAHSAKPPSWATPRAEAGAGDEHLHSDLDRGILRGQDRAGQVDAGRERGDPCHPVAGSEDHAVLVVDGRPV